MWKIGRYPSLLLLLFNYNSLLSYVALRINLIPFLFLPSVVLFFVVVADVAVVVVVVVVIVAIVLGHRI